MTNRPNRLPQRPGAQPAVAPGDQPLATQQSGIDPLSDVLRTVRLTGAVMFLVQASSPFVSEAPKAAAFAPVVLPGAQHLISFHILLRGGCWAGLVDEARLRIEPGEVLLVPHGDAYLLASAPDMRAQYGVEEAVAFFRSISSGQLPSVVVEGGGGAEQTEFICGFLGCDPRPFNPVLAALPRALCVRRSGEGRDGLDHLIDFALGELQARRSGGQCVLLRLTELMFVEVLRRYLASLEAPARGWLAGLRDPVVGRALALLHSRVAHPWTIATLASEVGLSRSALADHFSQLVGQPPMPYLTQWRMQVSIPRQSRGL